MKKKCEKKGKNFIMKLKVLFESEEEHEKLKEKNVKKVEVNEIQI